MVAEELIPLRPEVYPACEHRFPVECADGTRLCFVCHEELPPVEEKAPGRRQAKPSASSG